MWTAMGVHEMSTLLKSSLFGKTVNEGGGGHRSPKNGPHGLKQKKKEDIPPLNCTIAQKCGLREIKLDLLDLFG